MEIVKAGAKREMFLYFKQANTHKRYDKGIPSGPQLVLVDVCIVFESTMRSIGCTTPNQLDPLNTFHEEPDSLSLV